MKINDTNDVLVWLRTIDECRRSKAQLESSGALSAGEPAVFLAITNTPQAPNERNNMKKSQIMSWKTVWSAG